jgi:hypothetical protein
MKQLFLFFIIIFSFQSQAQNTIFKWAKGIQGNGFKSSKDIKVDVWGNVFMVGTFQGVADFDPDTTISNLTSAGNDDIFITKYTNNGNLIWCKRIGGANQDAAVKIALDSSGNVYITGSFIGTVDFNPGGLINVLSSIGGRNSFVCKLDNNGNYLWAKKFSNSYNQAFSLDCDASGNTYITGEFLQTVDFDPSAAIANLTSQGFANDMFIVKLDHLGNLIWVKAIVGDNSEFSSDIKVDQYGNVYSCGLFYGTADFDPSSATFNLSSTKPTTMDMFITKFDLNGNFLWAKSYGDSLDDIGNRLAIDLTGNVYCVGWLYGTINFDQGVSNFLISSAIQGSRNGFILKLNNLGNFVWANGILGAGEIVMGDLTLDSLSNIYITGNLIYTADFDFSAATYDLYSDAGPDLFIAKYDANGMFHFANNVGDTNPFAFGAYGNAIALDNNQNIFIIGGFGGTIDFDPSANVSTLTSQISNVNDIMIIKYGPCINSSSFQSFTFCPGNSITVGNNVYSLAGNYTDTLENSIGCDSIINTNITLYPTYDSTQTIYLCAGDSTLIEGIYIDSTSIYVQNILDSNGCNNSITSYVNVYQPVNTSVTINNNNLTSNYPPLAGVTYQWLNCNNNYNPLIGETNQSFTPFSNGSFAVVINNANCQDTSACYDFVTVGEKSFNDGNEFSISPNPLNDILTISIKNNTIKNTLITIYAANGNIVYTNNCISEKIDLSKLSSGIYFVQCSNSSTTFSKKITKL